MATATKTPVIFHYNLTLTPEEATTLLYLCNQIGGEPKISARRFADSIGEALTAIGVIAPDSCNGPLHDNGGLYFNHGSDKVIEEICYGKVDE